ncbi:hypothetical protein [Capnocytophaga sputigena]|uniref:hypothetical protein n=1 Tax=Capnocytophaga sputigena TaxID=1019 RepID=UPI0028F0A5DB|nr:hypothetical protein [Capnocytophaga sputigena]
MKFVKVKIKVILFVFPFLLACNHHKNLVDTENFVVDYDRDSIFYLLDVKEDDHNSKEKLLVTRQIMAGDSIFGYNGLQQNRDRAWDFYYANGEESRFRPRYLYTIFIEEDNVYKEIVQIGYVELQYTVILRQGYVYDRFNNRPEDCCSQGQYLRIMRMNENDMNSKSINVCYNNGRWNVFSEEEIKVDYFNEKQDRKVQYYIDSTCAGAEEINNVYDLSIDDGF